MAPAERQRRLKRALPQFLALCFLAVGAVVAVTAEPRAEAPPGDATLVLASDQALGDALRAGDKSVARKLLALQFSYVDEDGALHERRDFLGNLKIAAATPSGDAKAVVYGTVAVVTNHQKSTAAGEATGDTLGLHIWAKQKGTWRILTMQNVGLGSARAGPEEPDVPGVEASTYECKNPCQTIPYRVRSPAEQDVIAAFQAIEKANVAHDADEWGKHIADEFMVYRSGDAPISKSDRIALMKERKQRKISAVLGAIQSMRLWVFGDGAAMISTDGVADNSEPLLRVVRVWVRRGGQWQMAISARTLIK